MEHCRGSLVREGGSLESYWCPAPQEFKSLPRRCIFFNFMKKEYKISFFQMFHNRANRIPITGNAINSQIPVLI